MKTKMLRGILLVLVLTLLFGGGYWVGHHNSPTAQMQLENLGLQLDAAQTQQKLASLQQRHDEFLKVGGQYLTHCVRLTALLEESLTQNRRCLALLEGAQPSDGSLDIQRMKADVDDLEKAKGEIEKRNVLLGVRSHQQKNAQKMFEREEEILRQGIKEADSL